MTVHGAAKIFVAAGRKKKGGGGKKKPAADKFETGKLSGVQGVENFGQNFCRLSMSPLL
jgi:hypothetical protein